MVGKRFGKRVLKVAHIFFSEIFCGEVFLGAGGKQFSLRVEGLVEEMEGAELAGSTGLQPDGKTASPPFHS